MQELRRIHSFICFLKAAGGTQPLQAPGIVFASVNSVLVGTRTFSIFNNEIFPITDYPQRNNDIKKIVENYLATREIKAFTFHLKKKPMLVQCILIIRLGYSHNIEISFLNEIQPITDRHLHLLTTRLGCSVV